MSASWRRVREQRSLLERDGLRWDAIRRQLGGSSAPAEMVVRSLDTTNALRTGAPESRPYDKGKGSRSGHARRGAETTDRILPAEESPQSSACRYCGDSFLVKAWGGEGSGLGSSGPAS